MAGLVTAQQKKLLIDITNLTEENKARLRGALKFFNGEKNNTPVQVKNGKKILDCGSIYLNKDILNEITEIVSEENVNVDN